eukprot:365303-Chlamydomonas_euryale.AAC.35
MDCHLLQDALQSREIGDWGDCGHPLYFPLMTLPQRRTFGDSSGANPSRIHMGAEKSMTRFTRPAPGTCAQHLTPHAGSSYTSKLDISHSQLDDRSHSWGEHSRLSDQDMSKPLP